MGCKGSKQTEVESTYGELNTNTQKTMMLRAGLNFGELSWDYLKCTKETSRLPDTKKKIRNLCKL